MKRLFAAAAVAPLCFAASQVQAQTSVSTATTVPLVTSTAGDITITETGSILVNSGNAVTIDSNNTLTANGAIIVRNTPVGAAIQVDVPAGGRTSSITLNNNVGADDTDTSTDTDSDGDIDGPFAAAGTQRYGLRLTGPGVFTGNITQGANSVIGVKGNNGSSGVLIESGLTGNLSLSGQTVVLGSNSYGVRLAGPVVGDVTLSGQLLARGESAVGLAVEGPITGQLKIQGAMTVTGFRYTDRPSTAAARALLDADDLLIGGPAVRVENSISKGILLYARPANLSETDTDEDDDGIEDSLQPATSSISQFGSAAAILVGSQTNNIVLGNVGTGAYGGFGIALRGSVISQGVFDGISATGVRVGGLGGSVDTSGGINVRGSVGAVAALADSTAFVIGDKAVVPLFLNEGAINATSTSSTTVASASRGLVIEAGANLPTLTNVGNIGAVTVGETGSAIGVLDNSGTLNTIVNNGTVSGARRLVDGSLADGLSAAFDLHLNTTGISFTQRRLTATSPAPTVFGNILLGSGSDTLRLEDGLILGDVTFGAGNDTFTILNDGLFRGAITKGAGNLAIDVADGLLSLTNTGAVALSTLNVGSSSTLFFTANPQAADLSQLNGRFNVAGTATLQAGSKIDVAFGSKLDGPMSFTLIEAGSLQNLGLDTTLLGDVPFIYGAALVTDATSVKVNVTQKTAEQLGLGGSRSAAFSSFYEAFDLDQTVLNAVFSKTNQADFNALYNQFLPDYSGGVFQSIALGARGVMQAQADEPRDMSGEPRSWLQEISVGISQDSATEVTYRANGFGLAGGYEVPFGANNGVIGLMAAFTSAKVRDQDRSFSSLLAVSSFTAGGYWRGSWSGLLLDASVNGGYAWIDSDREVISESAGGVRDLQRTASGDWSGVVGSARFGASYNYDVGPYFFRPDVILDYIYLSESGYTETGAGNAINLQVDSRSTYEAGAEAGITMGARFGRSFRWGPELRIAYRTTLAGGLSETTARFVGAPNSPFTLSSIGADESRMIIRAALRGAGAYSNVALEAGGEIGDDYTAYLARLVIRFLF